MDDEKKTLKEEEVKVIKENGSNKAVWIITAFSVILIGVIIYLVFLKTPFKKDSYLEKTKINDPSKQAQLRQDAAAKEDALKADETKAEAALPPAPVELKESDGYLKEQADEYIDEPLIKLLFAEKEVIRKITAVITNIARGEKPKNHLEFVPFKEPFEVLKEGDRFRISERSFARYDQMVNIFISIDSQKLVNLFQQTEKLFDQAYQDLGNPQKPFRSVLNKAINEVLAIPVIFDKIYITEGVLSYDFIREDLQKQSNAKKQFFRLGPMNLRKVQKKLREIKSLLEN